MNLNVPLIDQLIDSWINEDLGRGDLSQYAISEQIKTAQWVSKERGVFCGGDLIKKVYKKL